MSAAGANSAQKRGRYILMFLLALLLSCEFWLSMAMGIEKATPLLNCIACVGLGPLKALLAECLYSSAYLCMRTYREAMANLA